MCICNNQLVLGMANNVLLRLDLNKTAYNDEVELCKIGEDSIGSMFMDNTGRHLIISMTSGKNLYLYRLSKKTKKLNKLKGFKITSVGWNQNMISDSTTGPILIGTSKGLIFEAEFSSAEDNQLFSQNAELYVKKVFTMVKENPQPITSIVFDRFTLNKDNNSQMLSYFILITLPGRLYQLQGNVNLNYESPIFQQIFANYEDLLDRFIELPMSNNCNHLLIYKPANEQKPGFNTNMIKFAWMTGHGIFIGNIADCIEMKQDDIVQNTKLFVYPEDEYEKIIQPISFVITEFHIILLYSDRLKMICMLNDTLVETDQYLENFGKLKGIYFDNLKQTLWTHTTKGVFRYKIVEEKRDIWKIYLQRNDFEMAKNYCPNKDACVETILNQEADYLFSNSKYEDSAKSYARGHRSFEEVALKFSKLTDKEPLKQFLLIKMGQFKKDHTQLVMLIGWLCEIWLNQLGQLKESGQEATSQYADLQDSFYGFLADKRIREIVTKNKNLIYDLISSHGEEKDLFYFSILIADSEKIITHYINQGNYSEALLQLSKQPNRDLIYKFSPKMIQHIAKELVDIWISIVPPLDARKLLPSLVLYHHLKHNLQVNEAVRYLEYCINVLKTKEECIHNYLIALYAKLDYHSKLMTYLKVQGMKSEGVDFDLKYALRQCSDHGQKLACVKIYSFMMLFNEAIDLALQLDVNLAVETVNKAEVDDDNKKRLWLKIAHHVVDEENDIKKVMDFVSKSNFLKIEDILPFFPDFVTIELFKESICTSLKQYNDHISELKIEMDEATQVADELRTKMLSFKNRCTEVKSKDKCMSCRLPLMMRAFYIFPCSHFFHIDCLITEVWNHLPNNLKSKVTELQRKISGRDKSSLQISQSNMNIQQHSSPQNIAVSNEDYLLYKKQLDGIVASECIYCGEIMIKCIDKPFIDEDQFESVLQSWA